MIEKALSVLNEYLFDNVWGTPNREHRHNFIPLYHGMMRRYWYYEGASFQLPTADTYLVYQIPVAMTDGLIPEYTASPWQTLTSLNNLHSLQFLVHDNGGKMLFRDQIYIYTKPIRGFYFLVINKKMFRAILGTITMPQDIYVAMYYDSDFSGDLQITSYVPLINNDVTVAYNTARTASIVYCNGNALKVNSILQFKVGDYIEVVNDGDIEGSFDIDLTVDDENRHFISVADGIDKQIVHIPKALNPEERIITHHTCDVFVYPKHGDTRVGRYVHRCHNTHPIKQITHNDFSLPVYILDAYKAILGVDEITLTVVIRRHGSERRLIRNKNYIDYLYSHDDNTILDFLEGIGPVNFTYWSAIELEQCEYTKMLTTQPQGVSEANLNKYIDALGYYHTLSVIATRVHRLHPNLNNPRVLLVDLPAVLPSSYQQVFAHVYHNGYKLADDMVTAAYASSLDKLKIVLDDTLTVVPTDEIVIEVFESRDPNSYRVTPIPTVASLTVPYSTISVWEEYEVETSVKAVGYTSTTRYREVDNTGNQYYSVVTDAEGTTITFTADAWDKTYIVQSTHGIHRITPDLTTMIDNNQPLAVYLELQDFGVVNSTVPALGAFDAIVFYNRKALVRGVDYQIYPVIDYNDTLAGHQLVVTNVSYFQAEDNRLEIYLVRDTVFNEEPGFVYARGDNPLGSMPLWFPTLSQLYFDGKVVAPVTVDRGQVITSTPARDAAFRGCRTTVPRQVKTLIDSYHTDDDSPRLLELRNYFFGMFQRPDVLAEYSHRIYSIFLVGVTEALLNGTLTVAYDPNPVSFLAQFSAYGYLKTFDPIYQNPDQIDLTFIDLVPAYRNNQASGLTWQIINWLAKLITAVDTVKDGEEVI